MQYCITHLLNSPDLQCLTSTGYFTHNWNHIFFQIKILIAQHFMNTVNNYRWEILKFTGFFLLLIMSPSFSLLPCLSLIFRCCTCKVCSALNVKIRGIFSFIQKCNNTLHDIQRCSKNYLLVFLLCFVFPASLQIASVEIFWIRCDTDWYNTDGRDSLKFVRNLSWSFYSYCYFHDWVLCFHAL